MSPNDRRHGTEAGNEQHVRDGEQPCPPCYQAKLVAARRRTKRKQMGYRYMVPLGPRVGALLTKLRDKGATHEDIARWADISPSQAWRCCVSEDTALVYARTKRKLLTMQPEPIVTPLGVTRRIQALMWLGYSTSVIARESGAHVDTIRDASRGPRKFLAAKVSTGVVEAYERLSMRPATGATQQDRAGVTRARNTARRLKWAPPLSWDDIDDPHERPKGTESVGYTTEIRASRVADLEHFAHMGDTLETACERLGVNPDTLWKWCNRHGHADLYERLAERTRRGANQWTEGRRTA